MVDLMICRYIPSATGAVYDVLKGMAQSHTSKKRRFESEDAELLSKVSAHLITKDTLSEKLAQHVEQVISSACKSLSVFEFEIVATSYR